jgi:hypothetical protein
MFSIPIPLSASSFNRGVTSSTVRMSDEYRIEEPDEVGSMCGGFQH